MNLLVGCQYKIYIMIKFCIYNIHPVFSKFYNMTLSSLHSSSRIQFSGDWVYKQFYFMIQMMYDKHSDLNKIAFLNVQVRGFLFQINTGIYHIEAWYLFVIILEACLGYKTFLDFKMLFTFHMSKTNNTKAKLYSPWSTCICRSMHNNFLYIYKHDQNEIQKS